MDFSLTEEQVLLRDSVAKFVSENCGVDRHRALCAQGKSFDPGTWQSFAELGWLAVPFDEELGGLGGGATELMVMAEAMGGALVREPYLHTVVTCGVLLDLAGSEEQKAAYLPAIIEGSAQWALASVEDNSSYEPGAVATSAVASGDGYLLNGGKHAVLNGDAADRLIVTAQTGDGIALFVVDAAGDGVTRESFVALDGGGGAHILLDNAAGQLLGGAGQGIDLLQRAIDRAIIFIGGEALGAMTCLLEATVEYTKTREQFGQPISKFQVLQHRMADMYMKVEETRSLLLNAAIQLDEGNPEAPAACAALKVKVADAGRHVSQEAVQLHGGIGMTDELIVGHHYKRLLLLGKLYGDEEYYLQRYASLAA
ncbi:MAG: acyl-CoA dehydrogenase family protein [Halioglobus sp.]